MVCKGTKNIISVTLWRGTPLFGGVRINRQECHNSATAAYAQILGQVVEAAGGHDALQLVTAPAEEGGKSPADGHGPAEHAHSGGLALGQLGAIETVADDIEPIVGDHAQRPDAGDASDGTCGRQNHDEGYMMAGALTYCGIIRLFFIMH